MGDFNDKCCIDYDRAFDYWNNAQLHSNRLWLGHATVLVGTAHILYKRLGQCYHSLYGYWSNMIM